MSKGKSYERSLVEQVLRESTTPLSAEEVASLAGVTKAMARKCLTNICRRGGAHNTNPGYNRNAKYSHGRAPMVARPTTPLIDHNPLPHGTYDGAELRPYAGRPGAMDAFHLPSLEGGRRVDRRAPSSLCISTKQVTP